MTHLVIITPKAGSFAYLLSFSSEFKKHAQSSLIDFLVSKFCLKDFSVNCHDGVVTFRVRS